MVHLALKSYLTNQTQVVSVKSAVSQEMLIKHGGSQASVLGKLLLTIYLKKILILRRP